MPETELASLLLKFRSNLIKQHEWEELKKRLNSIDDKSLLELLEQQWNENDLELPKSAAEELNAIWPNIRKRTLKQTVQISLNYLLKITAIILIPLLLGVSIYLLRDRKKLQDIGDNEMVVEVPKGQKASITLPDGSIVNLNSESSIRYKQNYGLNNRKVTLQGEAFFDIKKDSSKIFTVHTDHLDIEVLGTSFNVFAYEDEDYIEMALVSGCVIVKTLTTPLKTMIANPDEKILYHKISGKMQLEHTNAQTSTAWTRGELIFRSQPLFQVLTKIEHQFGIQIHLENQNIKNDRFTGHFEQNSLKEIMNSLQKHYQFEYQIKGNEVRIY